MDRHPLLRCCCSLSHRCTKAQAAQKAPTEQLERTANQAVRTGEGVLADFAAAKRSLDDQGVRWGELAGYGLLAAVTFGFAFQVLHRPCMPLPKLQ